MVQLFLPRNYYNLLPADTSQCHRFPGLIAVAGQLAYHVLHTASVKRNKRCANVHTKKTEHAVDTDEKGELDKPVEEEE